MCPPVRLTGPGGSIIEVPDESADHWRGLGYRDASAAKGESSRSSSAAPQPAKKAAAEKAQAKKPATTKSATKPAAKTKKS